MSLDRSPEFCFKCLIYRYLLETGHAPGDLACAKLWSMFGLRVIIGAYLNVVYQLMLHTKYQGSRPGVFRQDNFLCFHYM